MLAIRQLSKTGEFWQVLMLSETSILGIHFLIDKLFLKRGLIKTTRACEIKKFNYPRNWLEYAIIKRSNQNFQIKKRNFVTRLEKSRIFA